MEFREMYKRILGVEGGELNAKASKRVGITGTEGLYISTVTKIPVAQGPGLQRSDIIIQAR
jgi:hypothetical protein